MASYSKKPPKIFLKDFYGAPKVNYDDLRVLVKKGSFWYFCLGKAKAYLFCFLPKAGLYGRPLPGRSESGTHLCGFQTESTRTNLPATWKKAAFCLASGPLFTVAERGSFKPQITKTVSHIQNLSQDDKSYFQGFLTLFIHSSLMKRVFLSAIWAHGQFALC